MDDNNYTFNLCYDIDSSLSLITNYSYQENPIEYYPIFLSEEELKINTIYYYVPQKTLSSPSRKRSKVETERHTGDGDIFVATPLTSSSE